MFQYQAPPAALKNRTILITGASDGIGQALTLRFASLGATLILLGRDLGKLEQVYDCIENNDGNTPAIIQLNLLTATEHDYQQLARQVQEHFGQLHGLVHCAGILGEQTPIEQYPTDTWDSVMNVNARAPFMLSKALLPIMRDTPNSSMVFVSSSVGRQARAHWGAYSMSKFAIESLSQTLAEELENTSTVRVNSVNPGGTRTAMRAKAYPAEDPATRPHPAEITPVFEYLMSDDSIGTTGQKFDAQ